MDEEYRVVAPELQSCSQSPSQLFVTSGGMTATSPCKAVQECYERWLDRRAFNNRLEIRGIARRLRRATAWPAFQTKEPTSPHGGPRGLTEAPELNLVGHAMKDAAVTGNHGHAVDFEVSDM